MRKAVTSHREKAMRAKILGALTGVAAIFALAQPAAAMDMAKVHAQTAFDINSSAAAEVCAASMMGAAYMAAPGTDDAKLYTTLGRAWVSLALKDTGKTMGDYADTILTPNMQALYDDGDATVKFYKDYCLVASKKLMG